METRTVSKQKFATSTFQRLKRKRDQGGIFWVWSLATGFVHVVNSPRKKGFVNLRCLCCKCSFPIGWNLQAIFFYNLLASADQIWNIIPWYTSNFSYHNQQKSHGLYFYVNFYVNINFDFRWKFCAGTPYWDNIPIACQKVFLLIIFQVCFGLQLPLITPCHSIWKRYLAKKPRKS